MIVNLSLERSAKFTLTTTQPRESIQVVSAVDGSLSAFDQKNGLWLTAGQGVLLALGKCEPSADFFSVIEKSRGACGAPAVALLFNSTPYGVGTIR